MSHNYTKTIGPGDDLVEAVEDLPAGATLCLKPGRYDGGIHFMRSIVLRGLGSPSEVTIDAGGDYRVLTVGDQDLSVVVERVTLLGGATKMGGAFKLANTSHATLRDCVIAGNEATGRGGGAVYAAMGTLDLQRCRLVENTGGEGTAILTSGAAKVTLEDSLVVGPVDSPSALVHADEGSTVTVRRSTLVAGTAAPALSGEGTTTNRPVVSAEDSIVVGTPTLRNDAQLPAVFRVARSLLSARPDTAFDDGGGVRYGAPAFEAMGTEPYRPTAASPAVGMARGVGDDLTGTARAVIGATAGALEALRSKPN